MDERKSLLSGSRDESGSPLGWSALAVFVAIVVWMTLGPFTWLYFLGWVVALSAVEGISKLLARHPGRLPRWAVHIPSPGRLVAGLLRLGPESWLLAPRWGRARVAAGGFLICATVAGIMGWEAGQEYQLLETLRNQGQRTDATVIEIAERSEEGSALSLTVLFGTPSGPVRSDVDVSDSSATDAKPGTQIPVVYNPTHPAEVRFADYLDGREVDGIREGSIVIGLLAVGFLAGATWEVVRTKRQTEAGEEPGNHRSGA